MINRAHNRRYDRNNHQEWRGSPLDHSLSGYYHRMSSLPGIWRKRIGTSARIPLVPMGVADVIITQSNEGTD
jgi:hypothetical protein